MQRIAHLQWSRSPFEKPIRPLNGPVNGQRPDGHAGKGIHATIRMTIGRFTLNRFTLNRLERKSR